MLVTLAVALNLIFLAAIIWASFAHFSRTEREPLGARLLSVATIAGTVTNLWLSLRAPTAGAALAIISSVLSLVALGIFFAARHASPREQLSLAGSERTPGAVVNGGIYATIRHPFYASYIFYWLSWVFLTQFSLFACALAVGMIAAYTWTAQREEHLLRERLGEPYAKLLRTTWRFVPGVH